MMEEKSEMQFLEKLLIQGELSQKMLLFLFNNKLEKFDTSILENECRFNFGSNYKILLRLEKLGIIKKSKVASHNKNLYEVLDTEKLNELIEKIEKLK